MAVPTLRMHRMQVMSATNTVVAEAGNSFD